MPVIKTYSIGLWTTGSELITTIKVDAANKKQAEELGKEIADLLLPVLRTHYRSLGLGTGPLRLNVIAHSQ